MKDLVVSVLIAGSLGAACGTPASNTQERPDRLASAAPFLEDVTSFDLRSQISGRDYSISVALPFGYADSSESYPVLFALDANGLHS
jgi:hypothetical protein